MIASIGMANEFYLMHAGGEMKRMEGKRFTNGEQLYFLGYLSFSTISSDRTIFVGG
ncbi:hypothetical protein HNQ82_000425 [Anoxybacillus tengchongensis]|uniref:Uncharacterized protein n=1 Tax=Anoxybacillus tengchongensis TaxID=576944 RepID=A0A7W9YNU7_9BACL|nr:hypothetical protein [Anoxybacillus tengchongensis]